MEFQKFQVPFGIFFKIFICWGKKSESLPASAFALFLDRFIHGKLTAQAVALLIQIIEITGVLHIVTTVRE